ncbi:hypothetical protein K0M31_001470 [Melipona bicolor]|uniref:Uncharacterized protein n=1 Tax=Melipona bicolor TaxID=60889 RepID=A0AA40KXV0_9HYME|nr:hypothetical protein K0M31_001470 [Melipona bicolor]
MKSTPPISRDRQQSFNGARNRLICLATSEDMEERRSIERFERAKGPGEAAGRNGEI